MDPDVAACFDRSIPCSQAKSIGKQLLTGLQCLHALGIAQSDTNIGNQPLSPTHPIKDPSKGGESLSTRIDGKYNPLIPQRIYEDRPLREF